MSNGTGSTTQNAGDVVARAQAAGKAVYDAVNSTLQDPLKASTAASDAISHAISHSTAVKGVIDAFLLLLNPLLTAFFSVLSQVRHGTTESMGTTMAEILNEFLGTEFDSSVVAPSGNADATLARASALGKAVLDRLTQEFTGTTPSNAGPGEKAAQTFAGYGVNFGIQNGIIALIGSLVPETRLDEVREMGVEVAQNLGLGRLMRVALRPLVQTLIATPYLHELQQKYRPNLLADAEALAAWHAERVSHDIAHTWLVAQGHTDDMIAERLEQTKQRLTGAEWNILTALGKQGDDPAAYDDQAKGMDDDWVALRQSVHTWQRLASLRDRALTELLPSIKSGFLPAATIDGLTQHLGLPADEAALWRTIAYAWEQVPRRRISQAEMLFLYESAQVTDDEVETWLKAEGFSDLDVQLMLTYFRLKLIQAGHAASAAHAAALHKEHIAYVTDEITGLWSRPPTAQELNYWVNLLDSAQRTKHDFVTELKALPTTGPAMP